MAQVDPDMLADPSRWVPYPGGCDGCLASCCHLPVDVDMRDLVRLGWADETPTQSPVAAFLRLKAQGHVQAFNPTTGRFILRRGEAGRCHLLGEDGRCTAYARRPQTCRSFPEVGVRPGCCPRQQASTEGAHPPGSLAHPPPSGTMP